MLVSYLTLVSDLDLATPTHQFVTSPPVKYMCLGNLIQGVLGWLKFERGAGGLQETQKTKASTKTR